MTEKKIFNPIVNHYSDLELEKARTYFRMQKANNLDLKFKIYWAVMTILLALVFFRLGDNVFYSFSLTMIFFCGLFIILDFINLRKL